MILKAKQEIYQIFYGQEYGFQTLLRAATSKPGFGSESLRDGILGTAVTESLLAVLTEHLKSRL